jgi:hypothetical protein
MIWMPIPGFPGHKASPDGQILELNAEGYQMLWPVFDPRSGELQVEVNESRVSVPYLVALAYHRNYVAPPRRHHEAIRDRCDQGHLFTPQNTMRRTSRGRKIRKCKTCHRLAVARYRARRRAGLTKLP